MLVVSLLSSCVRLEEPPPNAEPEATIVAPLAGDLLYAGEPVVLLGVVGDEDDTAMSLVATWLIDGGVACSSLAGEAGATTCSVELPEGEVTLSLQARDPQGDLGTASLAVEVLPEPGPNTAPTCAITAPLAGERSVDGDTVLLTGLVGDAEQDPSTLAVTWHSSLDGDLAAATPDSTGNASLEWSSLSVGTHLLTLGAEDAEGEDCLATVEHAVLGLPSVEIVAPADGREGALGASILFVASVSDAEGSLDTITVEWRSSLDGPFASGYADSGGLQSAETSALSLGTHMIEAVATDADGLSSSSTLSVVVNGPPEAPSVSIAPDPATSSDDLLVSASAIDPEGDSLRYTYTWYMDGTLSLASASETLLAAATSRGETWRVEVVPSDSWQSGPAGSAEITIGNSPPVAPVLSLSPAAPIAGLDDITCAIDTPASDPDADALSWSFSWEVDGAPYTGTLATTAETDDTVPGELTLAGETWICVVTVTDGIDSTEARGSVTVVAP